MPTSAVRHLIQLVAAGVPIATGGLTPTAMATKITLDRGTYTVTDGPLDDAKKLVGGWALLECADVAEAVDWSKRTLGVIGSGEVRIRPLFSYEAAGEYGPE